MQRYISYLLFILAFFFLALSGFLFFTAMDSFLSIAGTAGLIYSSLALGMGLIVTRVGRKKHSGESITSYIDDEFASARLISRPGDSHSLLNQIKARKAENPEFESPYYDPLIDPFIKYILVRLEPLLELWKDPVQRPYVLQWIIFILLGLCGVFLLFFYSIALLAP